MIILIRMDPQRQTPMYLFLSHLSFCDLCYSTTIGPKMLVDLLAKNKPIPFYGCALQFSIACTFADSECLLLAVMAYDQYKAVKQPLALCSQHVQQGVLPAHAWGFPGGDNSFSDTHSINILFMLLWVKCD